MQIRNVIFLFGILSACISLFLLLPIGISLLYDEYDEALTFGVCLAFGFIFGVLCSCFTIPKNNEHLKLTTRDGVAVVAFSWIFATVFSALPFHLLTDISYAKALFEASSGLSTTGASIYADVEALPFGLLFWRSLIQWLGGLGIILFSLALLPFLGSGGMQLYKAEATGITKSKLVPRMVDTARSLWFIYTVLTLILWGLLYLQGMTSFDAINHAFTSLATGGFSTKNSSLATFSPMIQWTITFFMLLAGLNFTLHYLFILQGPKVYKNNEEATFYLFIIAVGILIITVVLYYGDTQAQSLAGETPVDFTFERALREASFHTISIITTTGFGISDYLIFPPLAQGLILLYMFTGACAGSTAGGMKIMRALISLKIMKNELAHLSHPHAIERIRMNGTSLDSDVLRGVTSFILIYLLACFLGTLILLACGYDMITSFTSSLTCISNVGPAFGDAGPAYTYAFMNDFALSCLSILMIFGRLELFTILLLLTPKFWRK